MSFDPSKITQSGASLPPRIVVSGAPKTGKTTFAAGAPDCLILPIKGEQGADGIKGAHIAPVIKSYEELTEALKFLAQGEHSFKSVAIDSISALEPLLQDAVCKEHNKKSIEQVLDGFGKGYVETFAKFRQITNGLDYLREKKGMNIIMVCHVIIRTINDPIAGSYDKFELKADKRILAWLEQWADSTLFINKKVFVSTEDGSFNKKVKRGIDPTGSRYLYTQGTPSHPGGGRDVYGRIPYEIELPEPPDNTFKAFTDAVEAQKQAESTEHN